VEAFTLPLHDVAGKMIKLVKKGEIKNKPKQDMTDCKKQKATPVPEGAVSKNPGKMEPFSAKWTPEDVQKMSLGGCKTLKAKPGLVSCVKFGKMVPMSKEKMQERIKKDKRIAALAASYQSVDAYVLPLDWDWQAVSVPSVFNEPEFFYWYENSTVTALEIKSTMYTNTFGAWTSPLYDFTPGGIATQFVEFYVVLDSYDYNASPYDPYYFPGIRLRINSGDENFVTSKELYSKSYPSYNMPPSQYETYSATYILTVDVSREVVYDYRLSLDLMDFDPNDAPYISYFLSDIEAWYYY
jgi:hypothetical protein